MSEITAKKAGDMGADDARTLLYWRDDAHEAYVYGLTMQQLLDLYHASAAYVTLEGWLEEERKAPAAYKRIAGRALSECD